MTIDKVFEYVWKEAQLMLTRAQTLGFEITWTWTEELQHSTHRGGWYGAECSVTIHMIFSQLKIVILLKTVDTFPFIQCFMYQICKILHADTSSPIYLILLYMTMYCLIQKHSSCRLLKLLVVCYNCGLRNNINLNRGRRADMTLHATA